ncbi:hypothetical protein GY21_08775 [Cryobacterium roopkundense]|uniref:Uncharacterized protein n=1 Tax=Cryobacterium roopkundense TaxID=1001240 RepID=A0A099JFB4_9MICO|nr:hypothetical protein [Cryobacterium roopkundense]KGJ76926.1 hypothetical protein GY21_08775 [Cryobacterium roopkundense]MBB5643166.1 hypothetical protein [Cryobacterium roopkundense]
MAFGVGSVMTGCAFLGSSGGVSELVGNPRPEREPVFQEPTDAEIQDASRMSWDCYFDPTMNDDWHDDVICRDGVESVRPILLPESGFVTEAEMIVAGEAFQVELNRYLRLGTRSASAEQTMSVCPAVSTPATSRDLRAAMRNRSVYEVNDRLAAEPEMYLVPAHKFGGGPDDAVAE